MTKKIAAFTEILSLTQPMLNISDAKELRLLSVSTPDYVPCFQIPPDRMVEL